MKAFYFLPIAIDCGDPATVKNGRRELSGTSFGNTVKYFCDDGFTLIGSSVRRCRRNGQWSGSVPECQSTSIAPCAVPFVMWCILFVCEGF